MQLRSFASSVFRLALCGGDCGEAPERDLRCVWRSGLSARFGVVRHPIVGEQPAPARCRGGAPGRQGAIAAKLRGVGRLGVNPGWSRIRLGQDVDSAVNLSRSPTGGPKSAGFSRSQAGTGSPSSPAQVLDRRRLHAWGPEDRPDLLRYEAQGPPDPETMRTAAHLLHRTAWAGRPTPKG
jgi:hypothetical protein